MTEKPKILICLECGREFGTEGKCEEHPHSALVDPSSQQARLWLKEQDDKRFLRAEFIWGLGFAIPTLFLGYVATIALFGPTDFGPRTTWIKLRPYVFGFVWSGFFFPSVWLGLYLAKRNFKPRFKNWWPKDPSTP